MAQFAIIAVREVPGQGTVAPGALVYRSFDVPDAATAVSTFVNEQQPQGSLKIWAIPVGQLQPYRVDVTRQQAVVAE